MLNTRLLPFATAAVLPAILLGNTCGPTSSVDVTTVRFVVDARGAGPQPLYLQVSPGDQPAWIHVSRNGQPVYLRPRCEIPDCSKPTVVCGAAIPIVRDAVKAGNVEFEWDGLESVVDPIAGCETQQATPPGNYVASFCYSRTAGMSGSDNTAVDKQGTVVNPVCKDVPFVLPLTTGAVTFQVPSGS